MIVSRSKVLLTLTNSESPDNIDQETTSEQHSSPIPTVESLSSSMGSSLRVRGLDFLAETSATLATAPDSTRSAGVDMASPCQYASGPLMTADIPEHSVLNSYNGSSSWYMPQNGFLDPSLAADSTDISSEFSYGSVLQPSPAPAWSRSSFEQDASLASTPGLSNWGKEDLMPLLSMESLELSPPMIPADSGWFSTPTADMSGNDSITLQVDASMAAFATNSLLDEDTPTQERPVGLPSSFVINDGHNQAPSDLRGHIEKIGNYYSPMTSLIHNSQVINGFVPESWVGLMTAIGLSGTGNHQVNEHAQNLFSSSAQLFDHVRFE